jgi:hypothetical protein
MNPAMCKAVSYLFVLPGLVPGIHVFKESPWVAGTSPAMTEGFVPAAIFVSPK